MCDHGDFKMKGVRLYFCFLSIMLSAAGCSSLERNHSGNEEKTIQSSQSSALSEANRPLADDVKPKSKKKEPNDPFALVTCVNGMETRTMSIGTHDGEGGGCEVRYEKNEQATLVPAYSSFGNEHCLRARDKMRGNLVKAGWKCVQ